VTGAEPPGPTTESQPAPAVAGDPRDERRTAVVIVHGMGEQRPLDMLKKFIRTALKPVGGKWSYYYSRPTEITDSYEARRYIAREVIAKGGAVEQWGAEVFEYHWSYLMTGNKLADLVPSTFRLLVRRPRNVPSQLLGAWRLVWLLLVLVPCAVGAWVHLKDQVPPKLSAVLGSAAVLAALGLARKALSSLVANSFVDVVRYLDTSPRSYAARRAIRGGMVALLRRLHDDEAYGRIVVVAHSLGGFIAYDGMTSLWDEMHEQHADLVPAAGSETVPLEGLRQLEWAADLLLDLRLPRGVDRTKAEAPVPDPLGTILEPRTPLGRYRHRQFVLWRGLRRQGNPWRITDFVTVGTPMSFAHLLVTRPKLLDGLRKQPAAEALFRDKIQRGELSRCPPRTETLPAEVADETTPVSYSGPRGGTVQVLGSQSMFAVVRWTNLRFPVARGSLRGDWFGGPVGPLFGAGVEDIAVNGNEKGRRAWAVPHTRYFDYPEDDSTDSIARYVRSALNLAMEPSTPTPSGPTAGPDLSATATPFPSADE
jgi:hypothetical protein